MDTDLHPCTISNTATCNCDVHCELARWRDHND